MKKMIVGVLGVAILGSCALVASEGNQVKTREALATADSLVKKASKEIKKLNNSAESLRSSAEAKKALLSSTDALRKAMVDQDYAYFPHGGRVISRIPEEKQDFGSCFWDGP